jgi:hypothetical protein
MINLGTIGAVAVAIGGNTSGLKKALTEADASLAKTETRMQAVKQVSAALGLALVAAAGAIAAMVKRNIDLADQAGKTATRVGMTTSALTELRYAAELSRVKVETFDMAMQRFTRRSAEAAMGTGQAKDALKELGVNLLDGQGNLRASDELLEDVADAMQGLSSEADRVRLAFKLFDSEGVAMVPMLTGGAAGLREMRNEAQLFGNVVSKKTAVSAAEFNNNLTRLGASFKGQVMQITEAVLPTLQTLSDRWVDNAKKTNDAANAAWAVDKALRSFATVGTLISTIFTVIGKTIGGVAAAIVQLVSGRWTEAFTTAKNITIDWKTETQAAATAVLDTWEDTSAKMGSIKFPTPGGGGGGGKPTKRMSKEDIDREKELQKQSTEGWIAHAEAVFAAAEEEALAIAQINEEKWRKIDEGLEAIRTSYKTEAELQQEKYDQELEMLRLALENKALTQEEFDMMAEQAATRHQERLTEIENKGLTDREKFTRASMYNQAKTIAGELVSITSGVAQHNKKLFELNKMAGIATAVMKAYEGISRTLGAYPFPINVAMAAAHGLAAFAQVQAIRNTSFAGAGAGVAPSVAGTTAATPVSPVGGGAGGAGGGQTTVLNVQGGEYISRGQMREIVDHLNEGSRDGSRIIFS